MSDLPVFFAGLAEEDIDQIEDYIASRDPAAASRVRQDRYCATGHTSWEN